MYGPSESDMRLLLALALLGFLALLLIVAGIGGWLLWLIFNPVHVG